MNTQEKSLKLAELMGWIIGYGPTRITAIGAGCHCQYRFEPYENTHDGLAQFAAILLKYKEVMARFCGVAEVNEGVRVAQIGGGVTQTNILDEILRMNGVEL